MEFGSDATGSLFFYTVVSVILTAAVILLASDPNSIDLNNPVFTNPAGLVDPKTSRALYTLLTRVDIVDWYTIFLMGLGLSKVVNKCSVGKGMALIGFWYVLFALLGTGLAVVF